MDLIMDMLRELRDYIRTPTSPTENGSELSTMNLQPDDTIGDAVTCDEQQIEVQPNGVNGVQVEVQQPIEVTVSTTDSPPSTTSFEVTVNGQVNEDLKSAITTENPVVEVCNRFEVKPMEAVVDEFHPLNQSNCNPGYETLEDSEMLDLHELISCESAIKHSIVEENEQDEENDDNGGGMLPFVYVQLILGTGCESTVNGSPKAWFEEVTSGLKVVLGQNAIGDEAHKVFDEMSQSFRAVLLDKPATMSHGRRFRSLSASVIDEVEVARIYSSNIVRHSSLTVLITYLNLTYQLLVECKNAILFSDMETFLFDPGGWSLPQTDCDPFGFIGEQGDFYLVTNVVEIMVALITHKDMIKNASICGVIVQNHGTYGDISEYEGFIRHVKASFSPVDSPDTVVGIGMWQTDNCVNDCFVNHLWVAHALNEGSAFSGSKGVLVPTRISMLGNSLLALYHNMDNPSGAIMILGHFKILEGVMVHLFLFTHPKDVRFTSLIIRIGWEVAREEVERAFTWESNKEDGGFNTRKKFSHAKVQPVKWDESFKHCIFLTWEQMQELFGELYLRVQRIDPNFENRSANASMICHIGRCNNILSLADNDVMLSFDPSGCSCLVSSWDGEDHFPPNWGGSFDNGQKIEVLSISFVSMWMYGVNFDKIPGGLISWSLKSHFIFNFTESLDDPCWKIFIIKVDDALVKAKEHCAKTFGEQLETNGQSLRSVMAALMAPERSVKWHGSLVARLLLEDRNLPLNDSVSDWGSSLLSTTFQAGKSQDLALAQVALSAFLVCIERSRDAREVVMEKGLPLLRETAEQTVRSKSVQESLAKALEILCRGECHMSLEESQMWSGILLPWVFGKQSSDALRASAINILSHILEDYGPSSLPISQGWLTLLLTDVLNSKKIALNKESSLPSSDKTKTQIDQSNLVAATQILNQLAGVVVNLAGIQLGVTSDNEDTFPLKGLLSIEPFTGPFKILKKDKNPKINAADSAVATLKGVKALAEVCGEDSVCLGKIVDYGALCLLRRLLLEDDFEQFAAIEAYDASRALETQERVSSVPGETSHAASDSTSLRVPPTAHIRRHAARLLTALSITPKAQKVIIFDDNWLKWLEECANGKIPGCTDLKIQSYARATLLNVLCSYKCPNLIVTNNASDSTSSDQHKPCPRYADMIYLINPERSHWKCPDSVSINSSDTSSPDGGGPVENEEAPSTARRDDEVASTSRSESSSQLDSSLFDIVFVHGLRGGPFKSWRLSEDKSSTKSGLVEKIDEEAGKEGSFWPGEWLSGDFPDARMFSLRYKTNLTQWSGATLPLQEVSSMLLEKLTAAGIGERPVVFVTHSMGGLVVKQMLFQAKAENKDNLIRNTAGLVFYSCPHFGSKLADMPWRMGLVLRPAPSIGELRSGSPRLLELNGFIQDLYKNGMVEVLSFCETKVTPLVEGYGGWAFRMEIVPIESAYPGFGELVVLESTDHINSCKPLSRTDPSYKETLDFLRKLKDRLT